LTYSGDIDPYVANLVAHCNGQRPLHVLLADVATALDSPLERIAPVCLEAVRRLIAYGFLLPAHAKAGKE
jgi:hypothetical protein